MTATLWHGHSSGFLRSDLPLVQRCGVRSSKTTNVTVPLLAADEGDAHFNALFTDTLTERTSAAMVLVNAGSIANAGKVQALQTAAKNLLDQAPSPRIMRHQFVLCEQSLAQSA